MFSFHTHQKTSSPFQANNIVFAIQNNKKSTIANGTQRYAKLFHEFHELNVMNASFYKLCGKLIDENMKKEITKIKKNHKQPSSQSFD